MQNVTVNLKKKKRKRKKLEKFAIKCVIERDFVVILLVCEAVVSISGCKATETFLDLTIFQQVADTPASQPHAN